MNSSVEGHQFETALANASTAVAGASFFSVFPPQAVKVNAKAESDKIKYFFIGKCFFHQQINKNYSNKPLPSFVFYCLYEAFDLGYQNTINKQIALGKYSLAISRYSFNVTFVNRKINKLSKCDFY